MTLPALARFVSDRYPAGLAPEVVDAGFGEPTPRVVGWLATDEVTALWNGLLDGRSALLRSIDLDGRRFLLVEPRKGGAGASRHGKLKRRVVRYAATGHSTKYIAIELGLSPSTVAYHLKTALAALGLPSRSELLRVLHMPMPAPSPENTLQNALLRVPADTIACRLGTIDGEHEYVLLAYALPQLPAMPGLSPTESQVVREVLAGRRTKEIALQRGTSVRTVANQIARSFRKLGVGSRTELCALAATPIATGEQPLPRPRALAAS